MALFSVLTYLLASYPADVLKHFLWRSASRPGGLAGIRRTGWPETYSQISIREITLAACTTQSGNPAAKARLCWRWPVAINRRRRYISAWYPAWLASASGEAYLRIEISAYRRTAASEAAVAGPIIHCFGYRKKAK
jgi:hypothetical protein